MSTTLIADTIDDTTVSRDDRGWLAKRTALMLNVSGGANAIVYNAIQDPLCTANNLVFGAVHPTLTALYCARVTGKAVDVDKVHIEAEYRPFAVYFFASSTQNALLSIGATVQSATTNLDINGATMYVNPPSNYTDPDPNIGTSLKKQGGTVQADFATIVLTFTRKEPSAPTAAILSYINTVNLYNANIAGTSYPPYTLKLDRIQSSPIDNGSGANSYMCTYEFAYNPATWVTTVTWTNSKGDVAVDETASPPVASTNTYWNYSKADFAFLFLW